jgi:hypothetical protein
MITVARLKELLSYDPDSGVFRWRVDRGPSGFAAKAGTVAGCIDQQGYRIMSVDGFKGCAHQFAWLYMTGERPPRRLTHWNRDRDDNRWSNIVLCGAYGRAS